MPYSTASTEIYNCSAEELERARDTCSCGLSRGWRDGDEAVATHDLDHLRPVGRPASRSVDHRTHLAEELRPDLRRAQGGQRLRIHGV